jgi:hypothetical protein
MSLPKAVFLDTSILDGQQFNFASTSLATFVPACVGRGLKLLLPDPTELEIKRHIKKRSLEALAALEEARRKAPFLAKWKGLPNLRTGDQWIVTSVANKEWSDFLRQFSVVKLGYDLVHLPTVMRWYDRTEAPFRAGKKQKEFPDALAVAMLAAYAEREKICVAVVSTDPDFKHACERFGELLYFSSLPSLTEVLLSDDARVEKYRIALEAGRKTLEEAIKDQASALMVQHVEQEFDIRNVAARGVEIAEVSIVGLGDNECTVAFTASIQLEVELAWEERSDDDAEYVVRDVDDSVDVSGMAKVRYNVGTDSVDSVTYIHFDDEDVEISQTPSRW